jgi:hypothetical protein
VTGARPTSQPGQAHSADGRGDARIKRSAWLLAAFAILFYVGYVAFSFWHTTGRG